MIKRAPKRKIDQKPKSLVGIVMGSDSDLGVMNGAVDVLEELKISYSIDFVSAHRTPDWMMEYARTAKERGLKTIIAGAGGAAHLPGMIASETQVPVVGVPIAGGTLGGLDALLSQVQMPKGVPVNVMGINGATNAAIAAAQILANEDVEIYARLVEYRKKMHDEVLEKNNKIQNLGSKEYLKRMKEC